MISSPKLRVSALIVGVVVCTVLLPETGVAQKEEHEERKVLTKVAPIYPDLAKHLHVGGVVKLEAVVGAKGAVKSVRVLGGNPVLIESASDAVRKWKFENAPADTVEVLQITFEAR